MKSDPQASPSQQQFLRKLSTNLHELVQPLSIIQASLELALLSPITAEQHQDVTKGALHDLQRAVECVQFIASLTRFQQPAKDMRETSIRTTLDGVISDLQCTLEAAQVQIVVGSSQDDPCLYISPTRLRQMLFYVIQAAQGCSQPGDVVHVEIQEKPGHVALWIEHSWGRNEEGDRPEPSTIASNVVERALALAETIVSSAGGEFRIAIDPLRVFADFPIATAATAPADRAVDKADAGDLSGIRWVVSSR